MLADILSVVYASIDDVEHRDGQKLHQIPLLDRAIFVQFKLKPFVINVIQVYAWTASSSEDNIETFNKRLDMMF